MNILSKVAKYIADNELIDKNDKIIVGVSGGADSVALLDILYRLGYQCIVAHCNFHLRDEESNRDALFVENICKNYHLSFISTDFDTVLYASENSISIEMAARDLRYQWFDELLTKYNAKSIAVAHHRDDSVETVLLNLIRGTGIKGLTGITPHNGNIIRPLLDISREDILNYLDDNNLSFVEDSTNKEDIYTRNKIRLSIIPLLETINPSVKLAINQMSSYLGQVNTIYDQYIQDSIKKVLIGNKIDIEILLNLIKPKAILFEILSKYNFNSTSIEQVFAILQSNNTSGKIFYSENYRLVKDRKYLIIDDKEIEELESDINIYADNLQIAYPIQLEIENLRNISSIKIEKSKDIIYLDKEKISFPLQIRKWKQGDWFIPFGMKGKKKISDYFTDNKFSIIDKENTWLLCNGDAIVWIIGHRTDDRFKIASATKEIIKITLIK